jgi:spoIIIJ-associated protein
VIPKPQIVIGESPAESPGVSVEGLEPSRARPRPSYEPTEADNEVVRSLSEELAAELPLDCELSFEHADYQRVYMNVRKGPAGALIGRRGAVVDALEHLLHRMVSHRLGHHVPVQLDVNQYRQRLAEELRAEAVERAHRVLDTGQDETLAPMHARERRIVHLAVQSLSGVSTYTLGEGSTKRIVIHREEPNPTADSPSSP